MTFDDFIGDLNEQKRIEGIVDALISDNPDRAEQTRKNSRLIGWFVGQAMAATDGQLKPGRIRDFIKFRLGISTDIDMVERGGAMIAGGLKVATYRVRDPETLEFGPQQFQMTYDNTVMAVLGPEAAQLLANFISMNGGVPVDDRWERFNRIAGDVLAGIPATEKNLSDTPPGYRGSDDPDSPDFDTDYVESKISTLIHAFQYQRDVELAQMKLQLGSVQHELMDMKKHYGIFDAHDDAHLVPAGEAR